MSTSRNHEPPPGISPADIYFVIFRHKWKILTLTLLGLVAATIFYFVNQPLYQSEAEIFIRYVTDIQIANPSSGSSSRMTSLLDPAVVMNSEMAILTSYDLAAKVATNCGPDKILAQLGGGSNATAAAVAVKSHLHVEATKDSSVLYVSFSHSDPALVQPVLQEVIAEYQDKHKQVHQQHRPDARPVVQQNFPVAVGHSRHRESIVHGQDQCRNHFHRRNRKILSGRNVPRPPRVVRSRASQFERQTRLPAMASQRRPPIPQRAIDSNRAVGKTRPLPFRLHAADGARTGNSTTCSSRATPTKASWSRKIAKQMLAVTKTKADMERQFPALAELASSFSVPAAASPATCPASVDPGALPRRKIEFLEDELAEIQSRVGQAQ